MSPLNCWLHPPVLLFQISFPAVCFSLFLHHRSGAVSEAASWTWLLYSCGRIWACRHIPWRSLPTCALLTPVIFLLSYSLPFVCTPPLVLLPYHIIIFNSKVCTIFCQWFMRRQNCSLDAIKHCVDNLSDTVNIQNLYYFSTFSKS